VVVVRLPVADHHPRLNQYPEHVDVEAFVAHPAVERLDIAVAPGLAGWDEVQADAFVGQCGAGKLGAVVAAQHGRITAVDGEAVELGDEVVTGDVAVDQAAKAFTGVFVHNGHDLDRAAVGGGVELEIHRPHHIRRIRGRRVRCRGRAETLAPTSLRHAIRGIYAPSGLLSTSSSRCPGRP
jgi:hypothetical protein